LGPWPPDPPHAVATAAGTAAAAAMPRKARREVARELMP
jgi:hypothetical protein